MNCENEKLNTLKNFIIENKDLAVQGSEQWLIERQYIIGGSEIASVIGKNPFSNVQNLIAQKIKLTSFTGNTACRWGNLFENVSEMLFRTLFGKKIYATGSIQNTVVPNHRYSPDGLCCMMFIENNIPIYKTTLLEFKSPYSSIPSAKVPVHYIPQVKAGLCTIGIAETAIFVNNMFRKCTLKQLDYTINYDTKYHRDTEKKLIGIDDAIATGLIMFSININKLDLFMQMYNKLHKVESECDSESECEMYTALESSGSESDPDEDYKHFDNGTNILYKIYKNIINFREDIAFDDKINNLNSSMIDLGSETKELFDQFLTLYKPESNPFIDIKCIKPQINKEAFIGNLPNFILPTELDYIKKDTHICKKYNSKKLINAFTNDCVTKQHIPIAYLPWKLLRSSNIIVEKEPDYLEIIKDKIDMCIDIVKDINTNSKSMDDTANLFEKHFANNSITKNYFESKLHSQEFLQEFL